MNSTIVTKTQQKYTYKLTNERLSIARMITTPETYNPNLDLIERIFYDYFAQNYEMSAQVYEELTNMIPRLYLHPLRQAWGFDYVWERYVPHKRNLIIKRRDYHEFLDIQNILGMEISPKLIERGYTQLYNDLIDYVQTKYKCPVRKDNVGIVYWSDFDISDELNQYVIYHFPYIYNQFENSPKNARARGETKYKHKKDLRTLLLDKLNIDFELQFRGIETKICALLEIWNANTKARPRELKRLSKKTKHEIITLFQATYPNTQLNTARLWQKMTVLITRRMLNPSYKAFRTLINVLNDFVDKRTAKKPHV